MTERSGGGKQSLSRRLQQEEARRLRERKIQPKEPDEGVGESPAGKE